MPVAVSMSSRTSGGFSFSVPLVLLLLVKNVTTQQLMTISPATPPIDPARTSTGVSPVEDASTGSS